MQVTSSSSPPVLISLIPHEGAIRRASREGRVDQIRDLLVNDFTRYTLLNSRDLKGMTPLHHAVKRGQLGVICFLLESGAHSGLADFRGRTPLNLSLRIGNDQPLRLLLFGTIQTATSSSSSSPSSSCAYSSSPSSSCSFSSHTKSREREAEEALSAAFERGDLQEQIVSLTKRALFFIEVNDWSRAALTLNSACTVAQNPSIPAQCEATLIRQLDQMEWRLINDEIEIKNTSKYYSSVKSYRHQLQMSRQTAVRELERNLDQEERLSLILPMLTDDYRMLLWSILSDCIRIAGRRPPIFAAVALGSMSRGEMGPYSDVEFVFLIKDNSEENRAYFRSIARLATLKITNLGETECRLIRLKTKDGEFIERSISPKGFSVDIAGLSPLGKEGLYELIGTPQELAHFQTESWLREHNSEIILVNAMTTALLIIGNEALLWAYQREINQILDQKSEISDELKVREIRAIELMRGYVEEFQPCLDQKKVDIRAFDVKQELYRLPQSVVSALALYYGLTSNSSYGRIEELQQNGLIDQVGAGVLKRTLNLALSLRLKTHFFYKSEREILYHSRITTSDDRETLFLITPDLIEKIHSIYRSNISIHKELSAFVKGDRKAFTRLGGIPNLRSDEKQFLFRKQLQLTNALESATSAVALNPNDPLSLLELALAQTDLGKVDKAVEYQKEALLILKKELRDQPSLEIATAFALDALGSSYTALGNYSQAIECHQSAFAIYKKIYTDPDLDVVANCLDGLGCAFLLYSDMDKAIECLNLSLAMKKEKYGDQPCLEIANSLNNLGVYYDRLGEHTQAVEHHSAALSMKKQIHGDRPHPDVAMSLANLGLAYSELSEHSQAIEYLINALTMHRQIYPDNSHPNIAMSLAGLGSAYSGLGEHDQAIEYRAAALTMYKQIYGDDPHPSVAACLNNLGLTYNTLKDYHRAIEYHSATLAMYMQLHHNEPHPNVAMSLMNLGGVYRIVNDHSKAIELFQKAYELYKQTVGEENPNTKAAKEAADALTSTVATQETTELSSSSSIVDPENQTT